MLQFAKVAIVAFIAMILAANGLQFRSKLAPHMCASGKSSWTSATGSGPLHLQACYARKGVKNKNTIFAMIGSESPPQTLLRRTNQNRQPFCLTNNGGPLPALALERPCLGNATVQLWSLGPAPLIRFQKSDYCWDTLGATQKFSRITLQMCDPTRPSQQWAFIR